MPRIDGRDKPLNETGEEDGADTADAEHKATPRKWNGVK
jgi:hypothetical protein